MKKYEINPANLIAELFAAIESEKWDRVKRRLADDFQFSGVVPYPLGKIDFILFQRALRLGIPELRFNLHDVKYKGNVINAKVKLVGVHNHDFVVPFSGLPSVPASGKLVSLPVAEVKFIVRDGKIAKFEVKTFPGGGIEGILQQLDANKLLVYADEEMIDY